MSQENVETIGRFYDAMVRRDLAGAIDFVDPDVVLINTPNSPDTAPYVGHDGLVRWVRDVQEGLRDLRVEADETIDLDDTRVLVVGRVCGECPASGLPVEIALTTVYTLRDGKIVRAEAYDTKPQALEAVGLRE
jgi:ketosteroid isomerase-like protein